MKSILAPPSGDERERIDDAKARAQLERAHQLFDARACQLDLIRDSLNAATSGLAWAPPKGRARPDTVVELLVARARAAAGLKQWEDATRDLSDAERWAQQSAEVSHAETHILLARAHIAFDQEDYRESYAQALRASKKAEESGAVGAVLACQSLRLAGDARTKWVMGAPKDWVAPEYWALYEVARKFNYPEGIQHILLTSLDKVRASDDEARALMGPFNVLFSHKSWGSSSMNDPGSTPLGEVTPAYDRQLSQVLEIMRPSFGDCYRDGLSADPNIQGTILLAITVGALGRVTTTHARALGLSQQVVECVAAQAANGDFPRPEEGSATVIIPFKFRRG